MFHAISGLNERGANAGRFASLDVKGLIPDHPRIFKVHTKSLIGIADHLQSRFAAFASRVWQVRAKIETVDSITLSHLHVPVYRVHLKLVINSTTTSGMFSKTF